MPSRAVPTTLLQCSSLCDGLHARVRCAMRAASRRAAKCVGAEHRQEQVDVTVQKPQVTDEPYTYSVVVCKPETRTRTVNVCNYVNEQLSRDVSYTVCVPKQEEVTVNRPKMFEEPYNYTVTVCKPETRTRTVNVCSYVSEQLRRAMCRTRCAFPNRSKSRSIVPRCSTSPTRTR